MDSQIRNRALLGLAEDGNPYLSLLDETGQVRAAFGSVELTNPATGLQEKRPCSSLVLMDEGGRLIWSAPHFETLSVQLPRKEAGKPASGG
jgi:hypothetical protein